VERPVVLIGQSRGGALARAVAARNPDLVGALVMLGSPVLDPLGVGPAVLGAVRSVARLGDLGVPGMFSTECRDGRCCAAFRADVEAPLPPALRAVSVYSRSDGIVSWEACLDPSAEHVEVESSHSGMSVNARVYRVLATILDEERDRWTG
jgi:pimeloyl-ACP methyl ester carboxylesterase